jgi:Mn2+/Fe2+ NRAMP family transporter
MVARELPADARGKRTGADRVIGRSKPRFLSTLGPGLITGAADDDPSGIGTYSQAGAQLGFGISWTMVVSYPLMVAIQEISARLGRVTGRGVAGNIRRYYSSALVQGIVALLFVANTINIGADLGAMADAVKQLVGGSGLVYVLGFGVLSVSAQIFVHYANYVRLLKWLTLSLFAYVAAVVAIRVPWAAALHGLLIPSVEWNSDFLTTVVAIAGTTISPYMFIWQAAEEAEDIRVKPRRWALIKARWQAPAALSRIRADTMIGMAFSNIIAVAIITTTAATLHANGVTTIETSGQAAEALRPIAGSFASAIFALGIVGTGLLAVPVLAGSTAYAVGEARRWPVGLGREPSEAVAFYGTMATAVLVGAGMDFTPVNPIQALYWSAVINGTVAVPIMIVVMSMSGQRRVMGEFIVRGWLRALGWTSTGAMAICVVGMVASWVT